MVDDSRRRNPSARGVAHGHGVLDFPFHLLSILSTTAALPLHRKLLYATLLAGLAGALVLGALEAALRLAGYGDSPHFARRATLADGETGWRENRGCTAPYFSPALARRPMPFRLPEKKAPGTYRIFILGSSAAMGDPEPSFSLARMLETLLRAAYPEKHFEIVNAGITAINSHLLRGYAEDCARLEPDLFVVYEGHNEVIGPFGPSGVFAPFFHSSGATRFAVWLEGTRTAQLFGAAARALAGERGAPAGWGGMQMFLRQQVSADDSRLDAVRAHFRSNLTAIAAAADRAGAATLFCTVLTNERDFAPFQSQHRANLSAEERARWQAHFEAGGRALRDGDLAAAEAAWREALAIDDRHAELVFRLGRLALQAGRDEAARPLLRRARDLDTLRFRTDSRLNEVVRTLDVEGHRATVVDVAGALAARSPHGIPGDDFLYEHVHLNFRGTYEAARELFAAVAADLTRRGLVEGPAPEALAYEEARLRLAYSTHEQAMIALNLLGRFKAAPFTAQSDNAARIDLWTRRADAAQALLGRREVLPALRRIYDNALLAAPDDWVLARNAGAMLVARQSPDEAVPLLQRALAWIDDDPDALLALGWAQRALGRDREAEAAFGRVRQLEPRYPGLPEK